MPDDGAQIRSIAWSETFPFLRLFRSFRFAIQPGRLLLALACITVCYTAGRLLDAFWVGADGGVAYVHNDRRNNEINAYVRMSDEQFQAWQSWALGRMAESDGAEAAGDDASDAAQPVAGEKDVHARGPFISLVDYEMDCFSAAVRGVCLGNWGFSGGVHSERPAMLGSIFSAGEGLLWLLTQRPFYLILYGMVHILAFGFFGTAICRSLAIQSARDETISLADSVRFASQKFGEVMLAPGFLVGVFIATGVFLILGGIVGAIPFLGEILAGLFFFLALLGGFVLTMVTLATLLGFHLMWPTIAVESSDGFDAVSRAASFVGQRTWATGCYSFVLLLYGAVTFVMVRLIAMILFKLTHLFVGVGMSFFGATSSSASEDIGKLAGMWHMPAFADLSLLPRAGDIPYWGVFGITDLSFSEGIGFFFIAVWVFLVVGLVGAYVINFYFAGSVEMYFLLRRSVDGTDYDEVFYEEAFDEQFATPAAAEGAAAAADGVGEPGEAGPGEGRSDSGGSGGDELAEGKPDNDRPAGA